MKIAMLHNDYLEAGGERVSVATEIAALRAAGVEVAPLTMTNENVQQMSALGKVRLTFPSRRIEGAVAEFLRIEQPDVVHAQNLFPQLGAGAIRAISATGIPWVRTIRNYRKGCIAGTLMRDGRPCTDCLSGFGRIPGVVHACYQESRAASIGATNYAHWDASAEALYPPAAYVLVSRAMEGAISSSLQPDVPRLVVHNVVAADPEAGTLAPADRTYDVAFVGRMATEKGLDVAVQLAELHPNLRFVFAGQGPRLDLVERLGSLPNVDHFRDLDAAAAFEVMRDSRVTIVPSQWNEPFGRVAAEALAAGSVAIVSARGGLPEIVAGLGPEQVVEDFASVVAWSSALRRALESPAHLSRASESGHNSWRRSFSPQASASRLTALYEQVIDA